MFISADCYYEIYLKGKDEKTVGAEVEKLRREIARLKAKMESPAYATEIHPYPSEITEISKYREYLWQALRELSGFRDGQLSSVLTAEERSDLNFEENVPKISTVTLNMGRFLQYKYELQLSDCCAVLSALHIGSEPTSCDIDRGEAIAQIRELHLGEWQDSYNAERFGFTVSEPTGWKLRIDYSDNVPSKYYEGLGAFPYNFNLLCRLMGVD